MYSLHRYKTPLILHSQTCKKTNMPNFLKNPIMVQNCNIVFVILSDQRMPCGQSSPGACLYKCANSHLWIILQYKLQLHARNSACESLQFGIVRQNRSCFRICYVTVAEGENPNGQ